MEAVGEFYTDLGFQASEDALFRITQAEIRKAYRSKALLCHPDKRPGDAVAAEEFRKLQKAYEVLSDEQARKAYDELLALRRARVEKEGKQSAKRQKMMQELRDRERAHELEQQQRRAEDATAERLKAEIARIRIARKGKSPKDLFKEVMKPSLSSKSEAKPAPSAAAAEEKERMIKVSWSRSEDGAGNYTAARLREIFQQFGAVEDVVVGWRKSGRKGSALLVMGSKDAAILATETDCGDFSSPLSVVLAHGPLEECKVSGTVYKESHKPSDVDRVNLVGSAYKNFEDATLLKLRQAAERAAERARLIKDLEKEDTEQVEARPQRSEV